FVRVASECHVAGLMSAKAGVLHLHVGDGVRGLELIREALRTTEIPARVFQPTHVNRRKALFEEALALAKLGVSVDVTAYPEGEGGDDDGLSARDALLAAFASGVDPARFTASSDGGGCLPSFDADGRVEHMDVGEPGSLASTLRELLQSGIPLERAIAPFTANWARVLRLSRKGRIEVGADADLVVLDEDHRIADVLCLGRWHVLCGALQQYGTFEPRPQA
ncbi:MAG: amidohydrolase family protein, partial [Planctomycetota bacterium]